MSACRRTLFVAAVLFAGSAASALAQAPGAAPPSAAPVPAVVASIAPVHALASAVMDGIGSPRLLLPGSASPHTASLKPSEARALAEAAVVVWVGPVLETFLERPLRSLAPGARVVTLMEAPGVNLLPIRQGGVWSADDDGHDHDRSHAKKPAKPAATAAKAPPAVDDRDHDDDHDDRAKDAHIWLDPTNAVAMTRAIAAALMAADPGRAAQYAANGERTEAALARLDDELRRTLEPVRDRPFAVFHDAYQYLEARYGLNAAGSITLGPERAPSARRIKQVRDAVRQRGARCVFAEPQFQPKLVDTLLAESGARRGVLDPLGAKAAPGPDAYASMMRDLAGALAACLAG